MKRLFTAGIVLLSLVQIAALAQTARRTPAKKTVSKKRPVIRKAMVGDTNVL